MANGPQKTRSGTEIASIYEPDGGPPANVGRPGEYPFTRGIYPSMYLGKVWTMRQYAGFGTPEETNRRFRYLLEQGQTGDRKSTRLNSSHVTTSRMPSSA